MKKGIAIGVCAFLIVAIATILYFIFPINETMPEGIIARVNGVSITKEQVNNTLTFNQIQMEALTTVLLQSTGREEKTQELLKDHSFPTTKDEVLNGLIRAEVACQQLEKQGKLISSENTIKTFEEEFALMQTSKSKESFYIVLQQVLESRKMTLEEYASLGRMVSYAFYNLEYLEQNFKNSDEYDETASETLDQQFDAYLSELVENAKVERVS